MIDYKRDINLAPAKAKTEFVRDVSSFANASGGNILIGMDEAEGLPTALTGIAKIDFEDLETQILQTCRAHIDPAINGIQIKPIQLSSGMFAVVVRIPKTWNSPHMVVMDGENRCWTRDQSGKRAMDIPDLRQALAYSEGAAERMKKFRMERLGNLMAGESPIPMTSNHCVVLHLLPLIAFTANFVIDPRNIDDISLPPIYSHSWNSTFTIDGKLTFSPGTNGSSPTYSLLFRNGVIEFAESDTLEPHAHGQYAGKKLFLREHGTSMLIEPLEAALKVYQKLDVPVPLFGAISYTAVKGYEMRSFSPWGGPHSAIAQRRDILALPEFIIEDLHTAPATLLAPILDIFWQSFGYPGMPKADRT
jgi:hypothetical protein